MKTDFARLCPFCRSQRLTATDLIHHKAVNWVRYLWKMFMFLTKKTKTDFQNLRGPFEWGAKIGFGPCLLLVIIGQTCQKRSRSFWIGAPDGSKTLHSYNLGTWNELLISKTDYHTILHVPEVGQNTVSRSRYAKIRCRRACKKAQKLKMLTSRGRYVQIPWKISFHVDCKNEPNSFHIPKPNKQTNKQTNCTYDIFLSVFEPSGAPLQNERLCFWHV